MCGLFPSEYTIYVIMVLWEGVEWQIRKRYSEFRYLHDFLLSKFGNRLGNPVFTLFQAHHFPSRAFTGSLSRSLAPTVSRLPSFPGKSYNPITHKAPSFIETRAGELALWLQSLCVYKEVIANPSFIDWMEMPQEVRCSFAILPSANSDSPAHQAVLTIHERSDSERDNSRPPKS